MARFFPVILEMSDWPSFSVVVVDRAADFVDDVVVADDGDLNVDDGVHRISKSRNNSKNSGMGWALGRRRCMISKADSRVIPTRLRSGTERDINKNNLKVI
jgi:hypothetical protein